MLKKVITTAILGVSALITLATNATLPGFYIEGQGGYLANGIKKDIKSVMMDDKIDQTEIDALLSKDFNKALFAGKLSVGYQFDQNFSAEAGYLRAFNMVSDSVSVGDNKFHFDFSTSVFDVVGKAMFPVADGVNVFGKLGVALLNLNFDAPAELDDKSRARVNILDNAKSWGPEVSAGFSFDITPNIVASLSATYILPLTKVKYYSLPGQTKEVTDTKRPSGMGFLSLGLAYNFA